MPLKTSYFNSGIFKNNIKRFWLITFSYTFFMFLLIIGYLNSAIERINRIDDYEVLIYIGKSIFNTNDIMVIFLGFYPLVTALAMFHMHFQKYGNDSLLAQSRSTLLRPLSFRAVCSKFLAYF